MKGPAISPALFQEQFMQHLMNADPSKLNVGNVENEEINTLGNTLKKMFSAKMLTRMWIDSKTNEVYCE